MHFFEGWDILDELWDLTSWLLSQTSKRPPFTTLAILLLLLFKKKKKKPLAY
jgi:hypothetical protein